MNVLAISASPTMEKSNTSMILDPFLEGARDAGADVEVLYTKNLDIKPCLGCLYCWVKVPGKCCRKDDMEGVLKKMDQADVLVAATPLYVDGMAAPLKNVFDRSVPDAVPYFEIFDGHCRHPLHNKKAS